MPLNRISLNVSPPAVDAAPARPALARPQTSSGIAARSFQAVRLPPPNNADDVRVQWKGSDGVIVTFTDRKSGEVVRQIPPEQMLHVARFIRQVLDEQQAPQVQPKRNR